MVPMSSAPSATTDSPTPNARTTRTVTEPRVRGAPPVVSSARQLRGGFAQGVQLAWADADRVHRQALTQFICTDPATNQYDRYRGVYHPRPWELEVQSHLRGMKLPRPPTEKLRLAYDDDGLAGAVHFCTDRDSDGNFRLLAIATALRCRGRKYGRALLDQAFDVLVRTREAEGQDIAAVLTYVHPQNEASMALFAGYGFELLEEADDYLALIGEV